MCEPDGWPQTLWLCSCAMAVPSASNGREEMDGDAWGHWTADPNVAVCQHEGPASQCQSAHGQKWVPMVTCELPVAKSHLLGLRAALQKPTRAMAVATAPMAEQQAEPTAPVPKKKPQAKTRPDPPRVEEQQSVQPRPVLSQLVEAFRQLRQEQQALNGRQVTLQQLSIALQNATMEEMQRWPRPQQQQQPMPQEPAAMRQQGTEQAVPLQQAPVQHQPELTMPLPIGLGLQASLSQRHGAPSGNAGVASCSDDAASAGAATASGSAGAPSGRKRATAHSSPSPSCKRRCLDKDPSELKEVLAKAEESVNASIKELGKNVLGKADC